MLRATTKLPRVARMTEASEFKNALRKKPSALGNSFSLHWVKALSNASQNPQLGFIVPKRILRRAIDRNRIKRALRESFRLNQTQLPAGLYLFRLKAAPKNVETTTLIKSARAEADLLLRKIQVRR